MTEALAALGGLPGVAALLTSLGTLWQVVRVKRDTKELRPNHGSSFRDLVARNSLKIDAVIERLDRLEKRDEQEFSKLWRAIRRNHRQNQ